MKVLLALILLLVGSACSTSAPMTFCNPLDLDYGIYRQGATGPYFRHGADPVIVLFNDRYYLFSTWDLPACRVSDDLVHWRTIPFTVPDDLAKQVYTAAGVAYLGEYLYFVSIPPRGEPTPVYRTREPESGRWEKVGELPRYADPCLFVDPRTGKTYMYHGLEQAARGVEVDLVNCREVPGTDTQLMPQFVPGSHIENGWEVCTWDNNPASPPGRSNKTANPCREGTWMTYYGGKYYLQYASPGTTVPGYADGVLIGDSPLGPFTYSNHSPISQKDSGFVTSAGHSCLFQDRHGNWWRAVTMLIGVRQRFERRIGLFPAGFGRDGVPYTRTDTLDLPMTIPAGRRDHAANVTAGWQVLSHRTAVTASTAIDGHAPELATDEDMRTHWAAATGGAGEWLQVDLGREREVRAVQVTLEDQDFTPEAVNPYRYRIEISADGNQWETIFDAGGGRGTLSSHKYVQLERAADVRFVRVSNVATPGGGKFAVSEVRVFGPSDAPKAGPVTTVAARRNAEDRRQATVEWSPVPGATGYLIRYGISPETLNHHYLIRKPDVGRWTVYSLNAQPPYYFRVDSISESGVTVGKAVAGAP